MDENTSLTSHFPTGKKEVGLLIFVLILCVLLADFMLYGGLNLGFAVTVMGCTLASVIYLMRSGCRLGFYSGALLVITLVIAASFVRSDDAFVKAVMLVFLLISGNLGMTLLAGKNRRDPRGLTSLLDAPMAMFTLGCGELPNAFGGLNDARKNSGAAGKKNLAVLAGLAVAVPVLAVLIPLLMKADAAFEGLLMLLPEIDFAEPIAALIVGIPLACGVYTRNAALKHAPKTQAAARARKQISHLTVNTVMIAVGIVYLVYLISQLAYFVGGFAGILPEGYTTAEYARRGFFEMTWLSVINLTIIILAVAMAERKEGRTPLSTRILCLFVGLVTLFFTATASAKMLLYIGTYGMTRLRLLTQVIIVFIALTTVYVSIWLFRSKFAYMKAVLLSALIIGAAVAWVDVDTVVAANNVEAYQSGALSTIDISHLRSLGDGAVPYIEKLTDDPTRHIRAAAIDELHDRAQVRNDDIRAWNIAGAIAEEILENYR